MAASLTQEYVESFFSLVAQCPLLETLVLSDPSIQCISVPPSFRSLRSLLFESLLLKELRFRSFRTHVDHSSVAKSSKVGRFRHLQSSSSPVASRRIMLRNTAEQKVRDRRSKRGSHSIEIGQQAICPLQ